MLIIDRYGAASEALSSALAGTDYVKRLERSMSSPGRSAVALGSFDAAVHTALHLCGTRSGDYVFVPTFTFYSYIWAVVGAGAVPVFLDCDPVTRCVSASALETALLWADLQHKLPKAVLIDNAFGAVADYDSLIPLCKAWGVHTVELCADAPQGTYKGKRCGENCDYGILGFDKRLHGGGAVLLCSDDSDEARRFTRNAYSDGESHDYRMNNFVAALDCAQSEASDKLASRARKNLAALCSALDIVAPPTPGDSAVYALTRAAYMTDELTAAGFDIKRPPPAHKLPIYRECCFFEHEPGYAACDAFGSYCLIGTDMSFLRRVKLIRMLKSGVDR